MYTARVIEVYPEPSWGGIPVVYEDGGRPMPQLYDKKGVDRKLHVWRKIKGGGYKCVLCGGIVVSRIPDDSSECERYEPLDETDRRLCPPPNK